MNPVSYADQALEVIEAQSAALAALQTIRAGTASPTLLGDLLVALPAAQRAPFMAELQKALTMSLQVLG